MADPGDFLIPEASDEILTVALSAVRDGPGTRSAWRRSPNSTASAWKSCCARTGRAARPPRTAATCWPVSPRAPFLMRGRWELEDVLLDDLEFAWGPPTRLSR
ncbi:hypothetical protein [Streptomyces atratus]|uniref:hypothetical protein n=1 Tax=Streptomyces atratus TaxID=1893 RepID=UPI0016706A89|nr:hypothetical protein [Streptomyces atratus]